LLRASKLVEGLSGERERWEASIKEFEIDQNNLVGDCAVAAAFLSYSGVFTSDYREYLMNECWLPAVRKAALSVSSDFAFHSFLAEPTDVMDWNIQVGLSCFLFALGF
jgi:dynein heavy chain